MSIHYFDALAGAGKTYALAAYADQLARRGIKVFFIQPSILLIENTVRDEIFPLRPGYPVRQIHGGVAADVIGALVAHFKETGPGGEILFATHSAFLKLPYIHKAGDWFVIMDEVPGVDVFEERIVPATHHLITRHFDFVPQGAAYGRLFAAIGEEAALGRIARNPQKDVVLAQFEGVARRVLSDDWEVFALQSGYDSLVQGQKSGRLTTYSLLKPTIFQEFKKAIIASACFQDTMLSRLWTAQGVPMKPVGQKLRKTLRYDRHQNGHLVEIYYLTDQDWSKTLRDREIEIGGVKTPVGERVVSVLGEIFAESPFAWMANKDIPDSLFVHLPGAERLPNFPHGLNNFQHLDNVVVLSALNPPPTHFAFMEAQGVDGDAVRTAHYRSAVYQAAMRISIRNPASQSQKMIVVMDRSTADWLADLFPGAQVELLEGTSIEVRKGQPGRPRRHVNDSDRVRQHRVKKQRQLLDELEAINGKAVIDLRYDEFLGSIDRAMACTATCNENTYKEGQIVTRSTSGTAFRSLYDTETYEHLDLEDDTSFIQLLRDLHDQKPTSKEDNFLLSPAHFNPEVDGAETRRGLANVTHVRGIWLDNDGGDLSHAEFAGLFPYLRIVVWNTYSSTPEKPRWRAFIPTSYAMSIEVHRVIMRQIDKVLRNAGYRSKEDVGKGRPSKNGCHGFDVSKFNAASLFYAPCQSADPAGSFFKDYADQKREPLDLHGWVENCIVELESEYEPVAPPTPDQTASPSCVMPQHPEPAEGLRALQQKLMAMKAQHIGARRDQWIAAAIDEWRTTPRGGGHDGFFGLAAALRRSGLDDYDIEQKLREEAAFAYSPAKRRSEIRGIMRSLKKLGTFRK